MTDHIVEPNKMVCLHCGLPKDREQNGIQGYRCGSSYCETFRPQWARTMTCLEIQNGQLQDRIKQLEESENRLLNWLTKDCPESVKKQISNAWAKAKKSKP